MKSAVERPLFSNQEGRCMNMQTRNRLFAYLAGAAFTVSAGADDPGRVADASCRVPESLLDEILDEVEGADWKEEDRLVLLSVLAGDARSHVRMRVSDLLLTGSERSFADVESLLLSLAEDADSEVRGAVSRAVADSLSNTDGLTRTRVAAEWALSDSWAVRDTLARALARNFQCLGAASVAAHLAEDPNPAVRETMVETAVSRFKENPQQYSEILTQLAADSNRRVRRAARRAEIAQS